MKHLITLISIIYSLNCFSQTPNPDLFQTWYLYDYYSTDYDEHHPTSAVIPAISPYVTFSQTSTIDGMGACNLFNGNFSITVDGFIEFDNFASTLLLCDAPEHISFEGAFFALFQSGSRQYTISGEGNNMHLRIS